VLTQRSEHNGAVVSRIQSYRKNSAPPCPLPRLFFNALARGFGVYPLIPTYLYCPSSSRTMIRSGAIHSIFDVNTRTRVLGSPERDSPVGPTVFRHFLCNNQH